MTDITIGTAGLAVYVDFVRANFDFLQRADEAGLDITGALTLGCWVWFDAESTGVSTGLLSKWYIPHQRAYLLYKSAPNSIEFVVSSNGDYDTIIRASDISINYTHGRWFYIVGRYTPGTELALFVNGMKYSSTKNIPAAIFDSSEPFEVGRYSRSNHLDGRITHAFICAYSVPDVFILAKYEHEKAMFMNRYIAAEYGGAGVQSSTSSSSTSSSTSTSTSISSSSSSTSTSTSISSSSTSVSSSSTSTSISTSTTTSSSTSSSTTSSSTSVSSISTSSSSSSSSTSSSTSSNSTSITSSSSSTTSSSSTSIPPEAPEALDKWITNRIAYDVVVAAEGEDTGTFEKWLTVRTYYYGYINMNIL